MKEWKPIPGFSAYEASHRGYVRSIDRLNGGRQLRGRVLKARVAGTSPYPLVNLTDDRGVRQTRTVHSLVLLAFAGPCPPGMEALHKHDNPEDNRWPEELSWGTHPDNVAQRMVNSPAAPKPVKVCARCQEPFEGNGRRCHGCVVAIGQEAARRLVSGEDLDKAALALDYPSVVGLMRLAVRYGGLRLTLAPLERQLPTVTTTRSDGGQDQQAAVTPRDQRNDHGPAPRRETRHGFRALRARLSPFRGRT